MRKLMMAVTAVAGLAVMTGCQRNGGEVQEQREEVAQAQQDVSEASREAREKVGQETAEVRQEAGQEVAQAQENLNEEQQQLRETQNEQQQELQQEQAQAGATSAPTTVQGSLQSKDDDMLVLTVTDQGNRQLRLKTDDQTRVMQNNREVKLDDIQEGSQVRASYVAEGEDMVARDVTVVTPAPKK